MLKKYKQVLEGCKDSAKGLAGYQWYLVETEHVIMERLCNKVKVDYIYRLVYMPLETDRCNYF